MNYKIYLLLSLFVVLISGCKKEGCTNANAINFSTDADKDDGSCTFSKVVFWARYNEYQDGIFTYDVTSINLTAGGSSVGNITSVYGSAPACSAGGCITYQIKGSSSVSWSAAIHLNDGTIVNKSGTANASSNQDCIAVQIDQ